MGVFSDRGPRRGLEILSSDSRSDSPRDKPQRTFYRIAYGKMHRRPLAMSRKIFSLACRMYAKHGLLARFARLRVWRTWKDARIHAIK